MFGQALVCCSMSSPGSQSGLRISTGSANASASQGVGEGSIHDMFSAEKVIT